MFTAALFRRARKEKQPIHPSTSEWVNKMDASLIHEVFHSSFSSKILFLALDFYSIYYLILNSNQTALCSWLLYVFVSSVSPNYILNFQSVGIGLDNFLCLPQYLVEMPSLSVVAEELGAVLVAAAAEILAGANTAGQF